MSHTNSTTNYALPQFLTSDKPAWLTDINNAFSDIDTAIKAAKDAGDDAQGDATQALSDAGDALTAASAADAKGAGAIASIETAFDPTTVYSVGAKVMYNNLLYRCTVAVTTPGPWTGSANWARITVDGLIDTNATAIDALDTVVTELTTDSEFDFKTFAEYTYNQITDVADVTEFKIYRRGNIGIMTVRFSANGDITSGLGNIPNNPPQAKYEIRGAIASRDGKTGFIQYSGNTFVIRCQASSQVYAGSIVFPLA